MKSWQWSVITHVFFAIFMSVLCVKLYTFFKPCPKVEPHDVVTKTEYITNEIIIRDTMWLKADPVLAEENRPEELTDDQDYYATEFELFEDDYEGVIYVDFILPDSVFSIYPDIIVFPDTITVVDTIVVKPVVARHGKKSRVFKAYLGGGVSFAYRDGFEIDGGKLDVGIAIKNTFIIYSSVDTHERIWLNAGILF